MESIVITKEIIERASDYIPLLQKTEMAEAIAQYCIARVKMERVDKSGNRHPLPDRYQERQLLTNLYLMGILAHEYLHIPYDGDNASKDDVPYYHLMMPLNTYDLYASSHVINQLEKLKADKDCKDKVFNILYDYRKLQRMIYDEIAFASDHQNDLVWRFLEVIEEGAKQAAYDAVNESFDDTEGQKQPVTVEEQIEEAKKKIAQFEEVKSKANKMAELLRGKIALAEMKSQGADVNA